MAALRNATVARLTTFRVLRFRIFFPLCWLVGHKPNQLANCFSLGKALRSAPASEITVCAVSTSMPLICDQSMPVIRYGAASGLVRVNVMALDAGATLSLVAWIELSE